MKHRNKFQIFNIERFATEDGDGIRTVVFLKGCGLRCRWCSNPESQVFSPQVIFKANACIGCGHCLKICPEGAVSLQNDYGYITDFKKCSLCGLCVEKCLSNARELLGTEYTVDELLREVLRDEQYFLQSGGGVTFSGGEPCFYAEAIAEAAERFHERRINVMVETCGHISRYRMTLISEHVDSIYYDIKHMDSDKHRILTGEGNELILDNLQFLLRNFAGKLTVRYPYIPGCNDDEAALKAFFQMLSDSGVREAVFLPYHRLGVEKYRGLGRDYALGNMPSLKKGELLFLHEQGAKYNIKVCIQ